MNKKQIKAEVIADSTDGRGNRITSLILTYPRIIHGEFMTHRVFSKNSSSSRAVPFKKMLEDVKKDPFIPIAFQKSHKGMQGTENLSGKRLKMARMAWIFASKVAILTSNLLNKITVTKQLCNRILEPFAWHRVLMTATEFDNFFTLRDHEDAEIHIRELAIQMQKAILESNPTNLKAGEWHQPFGDDTDDIRVSTARCARTSYNNFNGQSSSIENDIKLHNKLLISKPMHASPSEHCAMMMTDDEYNNKFHNGFCKNFKGFIQYRYFLENKTN